MQSNFGLTQKYFPKEPSGNANPGRQMFPQKFQSLCITVIHWSAYSHCSTIPSLWTTFTLHQCASSQQQRKPCASTLNGDRAMPHGQCRYISNFYCNT